jgi:hypothetical protein
MPCGRGRASVPLRLQPEGGAFFKRCVSLEDRCSNFWTGALRSTETHLGDLARFGKRVLFAVA